MRSRKTAPPDPRQTFTIHRQAEELEITGVSRINHQITGEPYSRVNADVELHKPLLSSVLGETLTTSTNPPAAPTPSTTEGSTISSTKRC